MDQTEALRYVKAAAATLALPLDEGRAQRVAGHVVLTASFAQQLESYPLAASDEPVVIYCPAPFLTGNVGRRET